MGEDVSSAPQVRIECSYGKRAMIGSDTKLSQLYFEANNVHLRQTKSLDALSIIYDMMIIICPKKAGLVTHFENIYDKMINSNDLKAGRIPPDPPSITLSEYKELCYGDATIVDDRGALEQVVELIQPSIKHQPLIKDMLMKDTLQLRKEYANIWNEKLKQSHVKKQKSTPNLKKHKSKQSPVKKHESTPNVDNGTSSDFKCTYIMTMTLIYINIYI
eukprot:GHVL01007247.1.p1 GENE.GHVL01007247.1~~GHVL01007247.1.p1  ORF type:complete len:217 (-),score=33.83 GHVL01007247.1:117-767(-)